ncbi:MAG: hypothetical protein M1530_00365 [Candidatus Marsarchaeota archaeon]|nr:hypothetical protein [Candidatus Marsarchaeota archaeon]
MPISGAPTTKAGAGNSLFGSFDSIPGAAVFKALPPIPSVRLLQAQDGEGRILRRFDFETAIRCANEQKKTLVPNLACDYLIKENALPRELEWSILFRTGTMFAYGPSDGKYIQVPVQKGEDCRIYLIPHPPEYLKENGHKGRQMVLAAFEFEDDGRPGMQVQIHADGIRRVLEFSKPERLRHLADCTLANEQAGYLDGNPFGVPVRTSGVERRHVMRLEGGQSNVGFIARFTHHNDYVEYVLHLSLSPLEKIPVLTYDCEVPAVESFVSLDY